MKDESSRSVALRRTIKEFIDVKVGNTASTSNSTYNAVTPAALRGLKRYGQSYPLELELSIILLRFA